MSSKLPGTAPATHVFFERLWLGPLGWFGVVALAGCLGVAALPVDALLALVVTVVATVALVALGLATTTTVSVTDGELLAGDAHIPLTLLGEVRELDADELRAELGPRLDARAHLCTRGWIHRAVRVELVDPADPTPYWIVSTRHPDALAAALRG
ncbi:DUF3093 domain-containing protein [Cellulomonas sp. PhB150]|uniref:DUF3093 domain-containing protein n=1 Tax=Cellulomonas sp. PhB150 TaxID=2485188 RepID=UPI000F488457|nr:DUF3093 domain-containing protein [Cellulomonas sp. PhB150]ROS30868.1 DUF3093 family protein [Cellulomonas sp. PhB150]